MRAIRTNLGESRPATRVYGDGSVDCPWCHNAISAVHNPHELAAGQCPNPWCDANPHATPATIQASRDKEASRLAQEAERKRNHAAAMARIDQERNDRARFYAETRQEAERRGSCVRCCIDKYSRVRFVKHRGACPNGR